jgi:hypothetical protein
MPQLTDDQIGEALVENGHQDVAEALAAKLDKEKETGRSPDDGGDMNARIRAAVGR